MSADADDSYQRPLETKPATVCSISGALSYEDARERDYRELLDQVTHLQTRCTGLLLELRALKARKEPR